jgi:UPF0755 protein
VKTAGKVVTVVFALGAFVVGFLGAAAALDVTQPSDRHSTAVVEFRVTKQDLSTAVIAAHLEKAGLIRNALLFRALARFRGLDKRIEAGVYHLSPNMTMDAIIQALLKGQPSEICITVAPGLRVTQYPDPAAFKNTKPPCNYNFTDLVNFDAKSFLKITTTGVLPDGTKLSDMYWYVPVKQPNTAYALEGYLFPDTYEFDTSWSEVEVILHMLNGLGEKLCPGPDDAHIKDYIHDPAKCKAHAVTVGPKKTNIFTEMENAFNTKDDRVALYRTLTLASIVVREAGQNPSDIPAVAGVYYNRYVLANTGYVTPYGETIVSLDADPTAQYARDTDNPPDTSNGGTWWAKLTDAAKNVDPGNLYNTANPDHKGLPPGPIAAPRFDDIANVALAVETPSPYYFFEHDCSGKIHLAKTSGDQAANIQQYPPC